MYLEFEYVHALAGTSQIHANLLSLSKVYSVISYSINSLLFSFFFFLTCIPVSLDFKEINSFLMYFENFNIYIFIGSKKFFIILLEILFLYFLRYRKDTSFITNILIASGFILPFVLLLAVAKSHNYDMFIHSRHYTYLGIFIIVFVIKSISCNAFNDRTKSFLNAILYCLFFWNMYVAFIFLVQSDYKISTIEVRQKFSSMEYLDRNQSDIFFRKCKS